MNVSCGAKFYDKANHLGNVQVVVSDKRVSICDEYLGVERFKAEVLSAMDYYPFGMMMPDRQWYANSDSGNYRFAFNGKEIDREHGGAGNVYDYGFRIYNPALGKFLSVDPLSPSYPWYTPYQFAGNKPVWAIDLDGLEEHIYTEEFKKQMRAALAIINYSECLTAYMKQTAHPEKADNIVVYFTISDGGTRAHPGANASTGSLNNTVLMIKQYRNMGAARKASLTPDAKRKYEEAEANFADQNLDFDEVLQQVENGKKVYSVAINANHLNKPVEEVTFSLMHEVVCHLSKHTDKDPSNDNKSGVDDHIDFYALDQAGHLEYFSQNYTAIMRGYSPPYKEIFSDSEAGSIKSEIEGVAQDIVLILNLKRENE